MLARIGTPEWVRKVAHFGANLNDDYGNDYPPELFEQAIQGAREELGTAVGASLTPRAIVNERHDFNEGQWGYNSLLITRHRPVRSVESLKFILGQTQILDVPSDWILQVVDGEIQMVPSAGTQTAYPLTALGFLQGNFSFFHGGQTIPGLYALSYHAGYNLLGDAKAYTVDVPLSAGAWVPPGRTSSFAGAMTIRLQAVTQTDLAFTVKGARYGDGKLLDGLRRSSSKVGGIGVPEVAQVAAHGQTAVTATEWSNVQSVTWNPPQGATGNITFSWSGVDPDSIDAPADITNCFGMMASLPILVIAGNLVAGAGIASKNVSLGGISQGINTTSSPENTGYSAQWRHYRDLIKSQMALLRRKYGQGLNVGAA